MFDKYIVNEENGKAGQTSNGTWYCKEISFENEVDLKQKIERINKVLNEVNHVDKKKN